MSGNNGIRKIESLDSYWFFDEENHRYMRTPKTEQPREAGRGALQDLVWHEYIKWTIDYPYPHPNHGQPRLKIDVRVDGPKIFCVVSPMPEVQA